MNRKRAFWIFVFLMVIAGGLWAYANWGKLKRYFAIKIKTKAEAIKYLLSVSPERNADLMQSFEEAFLIAWANADKVDDITFEYNGKTYYTATGTVKKNN